jgi:hypothetical protein
MKKFMFFLYTLTAITALAGTSSSDSDLNKASVNINVTATVPVISQLIITDSADSTTSVQNATIAYGTLSRTSTGGYTMPKTLYVKRSTSGQDVLIGTFEKVAVAFDGSTQLSTTTTLTLENSTETISSTLTLDNSTAAESTGGTSNQLYQFTVTSTLDASEVQAASSGNYSTQTPTTINVTLE